MVDVLPSHTNVKQYAQHHLAELEQMGQQKKSDGVPESGPKAKRLEEAGRLEGQKMKFQEGEAREAKPCKFYLTEQGCRKGKSCKFSHELKDEKRRCFACGSTQHLSPSCPTKEANTSSSPPKTASLKTKAVKKEAEEESEEQQEEATGEEEPKEEEKVSSILEEANKMLKSLMSKPSTTSSSRLDSKRLQEGKDFEVDSYSGRSFERKWALGLWGNTCSEMFVAWRRLESVREGVGHPGRWAPHSVVHDIDWCDGHGEPGS